MIIPPALFGDQRRLLHHVEVSLPGAATSIGADGFGNVVLDVRAAVVGRELEFEAWIALERHAAKGLRRVPREALREAQLLDPSPLTEPDAPLRAAAAALLESGDQGLALAGRINRWVNRSMSYERGVTGIDTSAPEAFRMRRGVCQDYAHVMLAICHAAGLACRYVSGHLLGEGAPHAWVEVFLPTNEHEDEAVAVPFDPTHGRQAGLSYLSVATGRDFADVSPTSGTYRGRHRGRLSSRRRVVLTDVEYAA